jgi:signal transduction histidine kinase/DNA-binding response OmpR family regulator
LTYFRANVIYYIEIYFLSIKSLLRRSIMPNIELLEKSMPVAPIRIAALGYQVPKMNKLMYRLDGFDKDWITVGESPIVTYSNLWHGDYVFRVKASNSDGIWGPEEHLLYIHILPPFYLSFWAYCIYILLFIVGSVYAFWYFRQRSSRLHRRQLEKFEQEKEREIYNAKIDFFTNVAHEIRTPLTLIKGPLENILLKKHLDPETHEDLNIMQHNTERLLNLTNQLLDFRKVESQGYSLNFTKCDITNILEETYMRFSSLSRQKGLDFNLELPEENFCAHVNREAFTKIISNLLNNGMKYADSYMHIKLEVDVETQAFYVVTKNDGVIIPDEMKEEIFQPFVRFSQKEEGKLATGAGIGLALSRSLAELHRGTLVMAPGEDANVFVLTLPIIQDTVITLDSDMENMDAELQTEASGEQYSDDKSEGKQSKESKHTVLVVEDNPEMLAFIERQLSSQYAVVTATNGREALEALDRNFVNLVVSDVVMPLMDGFELCKTIKSNVGYSHIPVILLTAKTNIQSKIEGMELGADSYIEKPFSPEYLLAVVSNLINNREKLRRDFAKSPFVAVNTMALTKADEEFIKKLNEIILSNLSNQEFSMDDMAESLNMSRSSFYRKMKGVLDLSPNEYLRIERLKRAAQLLKEGESRINEICYMVGFSSSSYFSKCFLKQFGVLPKDFAG